MRPAPAAVSGAPTVPGAARGRLELLTLAVALLLPLLVVVVVQARGWRDGWALLGVRAAAVPTLRDARSLPAAAAAVRAGLDPLDMTQAGDPRWSFLNYPRVWHLLGPLGLDDDDTTAVALVFISAAWLALLAFARTLPDGPSRAVLALGALSPAVLLGVERGNNDLVVFALVTAAVLALRRAAPASVGLLLSAHVLKLFPLAAMVCLVELPRRRWRLLAAGGAMVALHLALIAPDLPAISATNATQLGTVGSFGLGVVPRALRWPALIHLLRPLALVVVALAVVARWRGDALAGHQGRLTAFRAGAATYLGAFLIGPCWDYRLVFLLLALPQLLAWVRAERRLLAGCALALALLSLWSDLGCRLSGVAPRTWLYLDEAWNWGLYVGLTWLLVASLPDPRAWASGSDDASPGGEAS